MTARSDFRRPGGAAALGALLLGIALPLLAIAATSDASGTTTSTTSGPAVVAAPPSSGPETTTPDTLSPTTTLAPTTTESPTTSAPTTVAPTTTTTTLPPTTTTTTTTTSTTTAAPPTRPRAPAEEPSEALAPVFGVRVAPGVAIPGTTMSAVGRGFASGEMVTAMQYSTPLTLGAKRADERGVVTFTWVLADDITLDRHEVRLTGTRSGSVSAWFQVTDELPDSGADVGWVVVAAVVLVGAGAALAVATRRSDRRS